MRKKNDDLTRIYTVSLAHLHNGKWDVRVSNFNGDSILHAITSTKLSAKVKARHSAKKDRRQAARANDRVSYEVVV